MAEKEYIEREAMIQRLKNTPLFSNFNTGGIFLRDGVIDLVEKQPAADVVEVKHGCWVGYETDSYGMRDEKVWYKCSECGKDANGRCEDDEWYSYPILSDFCPHCGAKMDGEKEG